MGLVSRAPFIWFQSSLHPRLRLWAFHSGPLGGGGGWGSAEQHKGQVYLFEGACQCVHRDSQALVMIKNL